MATVTQTTAPVKYYAILTIGSSDQYGIATLIPGGYRFQAEGETTRRLVSYRDVNLTLLGRVDLADAAYAEDQVAGLVALAQGRSY